MKKITGLVMAIAVVLSFSTVRAEENLLGAGSTFAYPIYGGWAHDYHNETGIKVNYESIGSGGGVRKIESRSVDFGASDDALPPQDIEKDGFLQWPQVIGGEVIVINLPGIMSTEIVLDANTVCKVFLGEIRNWNDPAFKALNPKLNLPNKPITVVHRSDESGTTAVFTHYLSEACPHWKEKVGEGKSVKWPVGQSGNGNEGVSNYVHQLPGSFGYVEFAYVRQYNLTYTLLKNPAGKTVIPNLKSFAEAAAAGDYNPEKNFYTWATNVKSPNAWPIVAATNIIVASEKREANKKVVKFFDWAFSERGDEIAKKLTYAPLPESLKEKVRTYWKRHRIYYWKTYGIH